jgi:hypothetical protein
MASLAVSFAGVNSAYDDSWMGRGLNVVAIGPASNNVLFSGHFDTYVASAQSDLMLTYLQGLPVGSLVVVLAMDANDFWKDGTNNFTPELRAYLGTAFGANLATSLGWRDSYALVGVKGDTTPLVEQASAGGSGAITTSVDFAVDCSLAPSTSPAPSMTTTTLMPTMPTTPAPTPEPTAFTRCSLDLAATSAGFADGNLATLTVNIGGVDTEYDDSWMGRGFNVVVFGPDSNDVLSTGVFDPYSGAAQSSVMINFLQGIPDGSLVVVLAMDANDFWVAGTDNFTPELRAYLGSAFGATLAASLGWRDSYALIGVKGTATPLVEQTSAAGSGSVSSALDFTAECPVRRMLRGQ